MSQAAHDDEPLICHRCGAILRPGKGNFYLVKIEAMADPTPPNISGDEQSGDLSGEMTKLIEQLDCQSPQQLMDQVYRRMIMHLCAPCYQHWIDNPTG